MTIIRAPRKNENFTVLSNEVLRDTRLSYRARGILFSILSRPDNWSTSAESLAREGQEGRDAIRAALRELEDHGYLVRSRSQDKKGHWCHISTIYETPGQTGDGKPVVGSPVVGSPAVGEPGDVRSTDKKNQEEENPRTAAPLVSHSSFGGDGTEDEDEKRPLAPTRQIIGLFMDQWHLMKNDHPEYSMFPVVPHRIAAYKWLNDQYFKPPVGEPRSVEEVSQLVTTFMELVRNDQIIPKQGKSIWQSFVANIGRASAGDVVVEDVPGTIYL